MSSASKGRDREHRSARIMLKAGYTNFIRAAGSHGIWDVICWNDAQIAFIQVKSRDWPGKMEMEELMLDKVPPNGIKLIHRWKDGQRQPDVKVLQ